MSTQPARGMRDFLPDDVRRREFVIEVVRSTFERYGFEPLETPAIENIETLLGQYGEEGNKLIFKILKRGEHEASGQADLALRYDLTVPLARVVAEYQAKLPRFFRRYQIQPVWRADRPARGRFREFYQCDVDAIGTTSPVVEAELCAAASDVLQQLGFRDFVIRLNHRQLLTAVLDAAGVPPSLHGDALVGVDKLDKVGREGVARELTDRGVPAASASRLLDLFARFPLHGQTAAASSDPASASATTAREPTEPARPTAGVALEAGAGQAVGRNAAVVAELGAFVAGREGGEAAIANLEAILELCAATSAHGHVQLDPSLARGLSYYTGAILEIAVPDLAGSLGGGGRYDRLVGMFLGREVPACGLSLGLERIIVVMTERGMFPPAVQRPAAQVLVAQWSAGTAGEALEIARALRRAGLAVEVFPEADKLGKQFRYAASRNIPFVLVCGDDERARGEVSIKDMGQGAQASIARADAAQWLRSRLEASRSPKPERILNSEF